MGKNPNIKITTPKGEIVQVQTANGSYKAELTWNAGFGKQMTKQLDTAQAKFDSELMKTMQPYMPLDTGMMIKSMELATDVGSGIITVKTPYAHKVYYSKAGVGRKTGPLRGPRYFQRMVADKKPYLLNFMRKVADAK